MQPGDVVPLIPVIERVSRRLADSPDQAADLVQDCLLRLLDRIAAGTRIDSPRPYAMATLHNLHRQGLRDRKPMDDLTEDSAICPDDGPMALICQDLLRAISALTPDQSRLLALVILQESSPAALAKRTGLPVGTVMSRLARDRARLRIGLAL